MPVRLSVTRSHRARGLSSLLGLLGLLGPLSCAPDDDSKCERGPTDGETCGSAGVTSKDPSGASTTSAPPEPVNDTSTGTSAGPPPGLDYAAVDLDTARQHSCAVLDDGAIRCWGSNRWGRLGYGTLAGIPCTPYSGTCTAEAANPSVCCVGDDEPPRDFPPVVFDRPATQVATWEHGSCALLDDGEVQCWGAGFYGMLGGGEYDHEVCPVDELALSLDCTGDPACCVGDDESPSTTSPVPLGGRVTQIAAGPWSRHVCALVNEGEVRCWGRGDSGQLGLANTGNHVCPTAPDTNKFICAVDQRCCIGDDEAVDSVAPIELGGRALQVSVGSAHSCAVLEDGAVRCWGNNVNGTLGFANHDPERCNPSPGNDCDLDPSCCVGDDETPASMPPIELGGPVASVSAGANFTCALLRDGDVRCWGSNLEGQLGLGTWPALIGDDEHPSSAAPVQLGGAAVALGTGVRNACALLERGQVRCWGSQHGSVYEEAIGDDDVPSSFPPVPLDGPAIVQIAPGYNHTCARSVYGDVRCWGGGADGVNGYGDATNGVCEFGSYPFACDPPTCCVGWDHMPPPPVPL